MARMQLAIAILEELVLTRIYLGVYSAYEELFRNYLIGQIPTKEYIRLPWSTLRMLLI